MARRVTMAEVRVYCGNVQNLHDRQWSKQVACANSDRKWHCSRIGLSLVGLPDLCYRRMPTGSDFIKIAPHPRFDSWDIQQISAKTRLSVLKSSQPIISLLVPLIQKTYFQHQIGPALAIDSENPHVIGNLGVGDEGHRPAGETSDSCYWSFRQGWRSRTMATPVSYSIILVMERVNPSLPNPVPKPFGGDTSDAV